MLNPTFTWGTTCYVNKKGSESRRRDPTTSTPRHITRKHPHTTTRDEAPGGRGIVLNPTFTWGTTCYVNKKGSESRCCYSATP